MIICESWISGPRTTLLDEGDKTEMGKQWHGIRAQLVQRALKEENIRVILRQVAHLQTDISKVMNADFL